MIVNDLMPGVIQKLRGRDDMTPLIPLAIRAVVLDLTESYEFEELKVTGPIANFVVNQAEYPTRGYDPLGIQGNPFIQDGTVRLTFISSWFVWYNTSGQVTPGIDQGMEIKQRSLRSVEPMSKVLGIPSICCIHGDKETSGVIIVGNMPNNPYACQMRYQREHPFVGTDAPLQLIQSQRIYMPKDWQDIVEYASAEKILRAPLGLNSIASEYHQLLFGYKDKYGIETPGLIQARQSVQQRMESYNERRVLPMIRRYT